MNESLRVLRRELVDEFSVKRTACIARRKRDDYLQGQLSTLLDVIQRIDGLLIEDKEE